MNMIAKNCRGLTKLGIVESGPGQGVEVKNAMKKSKTCNTANPTPILKN